MGYGAIIKRAWTITWRYRALWVLGLFAGAASGGRIGSNYNTGSPGSGSGSGMDRLSAGFLRSLERLLPIIIVAALGLIIIGIVWWILSIAARGGLVYAVNEIEEGRPMSLGPAWNAGFARFWSVFGLSLLLALPILLLLLVIVLLTVPPIVVPLMRGGEPGIAAFAPICGSLAIGVPLLLVLSIVLGLLQQLALRFVMISGFGAVRAIAESWAMFRRRFKDTALMWLISAGLDVAASLVLAIPIVILTLIVIVPAMVAGVSGEWAAFAAVMVVAMLLVMVISFAFTAVWGTFSSALWTVFFRRLTGMEVVAPIELPATSAPGAPAPSAVVGPPMAPVLPPPAEPAS